MQKIYSNDDIQDMITAVNADQKLKEKVLSHFSGNDLHAMQDVLNDGWYERFDRYDSDICEQFIKAYEVEA
jgi:hypothetical protein